MAYSSKKDDTVRTILQMTKLRVRRVKQHTQESTVRKQKSVTQIWEGTALQPLFLCNARYFP